jgi:hypothetical protein
MNTLQDLLTILGGQQLAAGYLTPAGNGSAHDTVRALKQGFDPFTLTSNPLPGMTNQPGAPNILLSPAWIGSLGVGQDAIFLNGVDGKLDLSHAGPAYRFSSVGGGGGPVQNYSLFLPSLTPDHPTNTQANINVGIIFQTTIPGNVIAVRYYRAPASTLQTQIGALWLVSNHSKLGQVNFSGQSASGWQQMNFASPIAILANTQYLISMFIPDGAFVYNSTNPPITTGVLQAPAGAGQFDTTAGVLGYPANQQAGVNYMVDLVFQG